MKQGETADAFQLARKLLQDKHDLMHKATGWVLRETGKVSRPDLLRFLEKCYRSFHELRFATPSSISRLHSGRRSWRASSDARAKKCGSQRKRVAIRVREIAVLLHRQKLPFLVRTASAGILLYCSAIRKRSAGDLKAQTAINWLNGEIAI